MAQRDAVDHGDRGLGQHAHRRHDDLELVGSDLAHREQRLVLPGEQHVAETVVHEGGRGTACAGVEHRYVRVQLAQKLARTLVVAARLRARPRPGGQVVPAGAARGLRVRGDHRHAAPHQIAPVVDTFWVARAHHEDDGRGVGRAVIGQQALPVDRQQPAGGGDRVDIGRERQRHDVRRVAFDDRAGLRRRAAVRHLDTHLLSRLRLPVAAEGRVDFRVQLARRVVGDVAQRDALGVRAAAARAAAGEQRRERQQTHRKAGRASRQRRLGRSHAQMLAAPRLRRGYSGRRSARRRCGSSSSAHSLTLPGPPSSAS